MNDQPETDWLDDAEKRCEAATEGPLEWQRFGEEWCLTGQYGMRPIVLAVRRGKLTNLVNGLLDPLNPEHPDSKMIAGAYTDLPRAIRALRAADRLEKDCEMWGFCRTTREAYLRTRYGEKG